MAANFFIPRTKAKISADKAQSEEKEKERKTLYDKNKRVRTVQPSWLKEFTWLR